MGNSILFIFASLAFQDQRECTCDVEIRKVVADVKVERTGKKERPCVVGLTATIKTTIFAERPERAEAIATVYTVLGDIAESSLEFDVVLKVWLKSDPSQSFETIRKWNAAAPDRILTISIFDVPCPGTEFTSTAEIKKLKDLVDALKPRAKAAITAAPADYDLNLAVVDFEVVDINVYLKGDRLGFLVSAGVDCAGTRDADLFESGWSLNANGKGHVEGPDK